MLIATLAFPSILIATPAEESSAEQAANTSSETSSDIASLRAQASAARIRLDQLAYETEMASENYFEAQELLETTLAEIARSEEELVDNQVQLDRVSDLLSERAVSTYTNNGELSFVSFLFGSTSLTDLFDRINLLQVIMDNDASIIRDVRQLRSEIQLSKNRLEEKREVEREAAERAETEFENVQTSLNAQQSLLASLDGEVARLVEEERAAIEAEQIRRAEERQAAEERERLAQEEAEEERSAQESNDEEAASSDATASTSNGTSGGSSGSGQNTTAGTNTSNNAGNNAGTTSGGSSGSSANSNTSSGNNSNGSSNASNNNSSSNAGSSGNNSSSSGSNSSSNSNQSTPSLGRERPGVVTVARRFVGVTPYLWGGTTPAGFDCSGLVQFAYREAYGINLPRTSRQQFHAGVFIPPNRSDLMRPGDLVFFSRTGRPENIHHVGIFVGNNRMIHAPSSGRFVSEQTIWRSDFIGAVRP